MPTHPHATTLNLGPFATIGLDDALVGALLHEHERRAAPELHRLWAYYRNPAEPRGAALTGPARSLRPFRLAQEDGLPARLRGERSALDDDRGAEREVVIENDIGWRIDAMVDFVFGKPARLLSQAPDPQKRAEIERLLDAVWEESGGVTLLQDAGLLGAVYGSADLALRTGEFFDSVRRLGDTRRSFDGVIDLARRLRVEVIDPIRGVPVPDASDPRRAAAYLVLGAAPSAASRGAGAQRSLLARVLERVAGAADADPRAANAPRSLEILAPDHTQRYEGGRLVLDEPNPLGVLPVVHVQNASQPGAYRGMSDVEPLIPLQDELNTRLSDRAHRVTLQSFNMYLAKGIEPGPGGPMRIAPGQVWTTDNPDADIKAFGGDGHSPSEEAHIEQVRDALDKTSSVSPVAIGVIRARLGHLSSENALRITLMGVLSKTARKRVAYGRGIAEMSGLILHALDVAGVYRTRERDQRVRVEWPDPLPTDERSVLEAARLKRELGVPAERVLADLGYPPVRPPVNPPVGPPVGPPTDAPSDPGIV